MAMDIERSFARPSAVDNYASLASFVTVDRDKSTWIFRRFDNLAARNLLYFQSELVELEARQNAFDQEDLRAPMDSKACTREWAVFAARAKEANNAHEKNRMELAMEIRRKLKEYREFGEESVKAQIVMDILGEAVIFEREMTSISRPSQRTIEAFRNVFHNVNGRRQKGISALGGNSETVLEDPNDLMSLQIKADDDRLTRLLQRYCPVFFIVSTI